MKRHELKTDKKPFFDVWNDLKKFEIRLNDRDFLVGDVLILEQTTFTGEDMKNGAPLEYTGLFIEAQVTHIMSGPIYGLVDGWCIMSINPVKKGTMLWIQTK